MIFNTYWFICAVVPYLVLYLLVPFPKFRFALLILFCAVFHFHFAGPAGVLPIILLGLVTYFSGLSGNKHIIRSAIIFCVLSLCFYKYSFFVANQVVGLIFPASGKLLSAYAKDVLPAMPPLAISFFTFEFVHYLYELQKGGAPIKSPFRFLAFAIFFPSLVAGPIKRYQSFLEALDDGLKSKFGSHVISGFLLVLIGFFKKLVIADNLTLFTESYSDRFIELPLIGRWLFLIALSYRIYMDFSGYSDIAIGLGRMMGITLPQNFNWPYIATNLQDFWQRWHMSLSLWIRDYIYIPLGGNRSGLMRTIVNAGIAFALCGLWHGAQWHYVLWGLYHGFGLAVCLSYRKVFGNAGESLYEFLTKVPYLKVLITFLYVSFGWLLFFYPPAEALFKFSLLFTGGSL